MSISLFLFFVIHFLLLLLLYWFLEEQGFGVANYTVGAIVFLLASALSSYVVLADILEPKVRQDERLSHLAREILHEINLPIATIDANASMLAKNCTSQKELKRTNRIKAATVRLRRLYAELSYSIRKEILPVEKETFDLREVLRERVDVQKELGRNPFVLALQSCIIEADKIGMEQAIDNIIENAMKYSESKEPIEITLQDSILSIQDHGKGMDAGQILHIYERYYQGDVSLAGEGIGLTLVKRYCDDAGIGIKIHSLENEGTKVMLECANIVIQAKGDL